MFGGLYTFFFSFFVINDKDTTKWDNNFTTFLNLHTKKKKN